MVGPLPRFKECTFVIVVIDYFSKWIEMKALTSTTEFKVIKFLKSRIVYRYGIPSILVTDTGPQFSGK